jgi:hypothetical protein
MAAGVSCARFLALRVHATNKLPCLGCIPEIPRPHYLIAMARTKSSALESKGKGGKLPRKSAKTTKSKEGAKGLVKRTAKPVPREGDPKKRKKPRFHPGTRARITARRLRKQDMVIPESFIRARILRSTSDYMRKKDTLAAEKDPKSPALLEPGTSDLRIGAKALRLVQRDVDDYLFDLAVETVRINRETSRNIRGEFVSRPITVGHVLMAAKAIEQRAS